MKIAIIGCGYIGSATAKLWIKRGYHLTATTRRQKNLTLLTQLVPKSLLLTGDDPAEFAPIIANNEIILVSAAASSQEVYEATYLNIAKIFHHLALEMNTPRRLIYISSTSVYGNHRGLWVDETSALYPITTNEKILVETEKVYLSLKEIGWTICELRFAEIYGPNREISKRVTQLQGHTLPGTGNLYTNMVHKDDCAGAIDFVLQRDLEGIFNVADDDHPTRKELYDDIAKKFTLAPVEWDSKLSAMHKNNKRVSNHKIKSSGFCLVHPNRILI